MGHRLIAEESLSLLIHPLVSYNKMSKNEMEKKGSGRGVGGGYSDQVEGKCYNRMMLGSEHVCVCVRCGLCS